MLAIQCAKQLKRCLDRTVINIDINSHTNCKYLSTCHLHANQPTVTVVPLCHKKVGHPYSRRFVFVK